VASQYGADIPKLFEERRIPLLDAIKQLAWVVLRALQFCVQPLSVDHDSRPVRIGLALIAHRRVITEAVYALDPVIDVG
jgi:hypothetical protein